MNVIAAVKAYITKMTEDSEPGMKVLVLDRETTGIVSMAYGQSEIQQKEVYLLERLDSPNYAAAPGLRYLKCLVFVRPTPRNVELLCEELRSPKYCAYHLHFSNIVAKADIKRLAEHDEQEVVREVREFYMDYLAVNRHLFSLGLPACLSPADPWAWEPQALARSVQGVVALLLSLKRCPHIRYRAGSEPCLRLAQQVEDAMNREASLFSFPQAGGQSLLLVLDRREDAVTPLLNQWTYQAMVHELLTINNNRVGLGHVPDVPADLAEVIMSADQDPFYSRNMYMNYGEIGQNIKELMDQFQAKVKSQKRIDSIADMKCFVEAYPQFKRLSGSVAKHVTVVGELSAMVARHCLLDVSEVEQEIASQDDRSAQLAGVRRLLGDERVRESDAVKLVMLYALKYGSSDVTSLINLLKKRRTSQRWLRAVCGVLEYAGSLSGGGGAGGRRGAAETLNVESAVNITKRMFKGLSGVDNVYTQHRPLLHDVLDDVAKGRLKEAAYPFVRNHGAPGGGAGARPQNVIVFVVGGATYEESLTVHTFNKANPGVSALLGGTHVHNSTSFLAEVEQATAGAPRKLTRNIHNVE